MSSYYRRYSEFQWYSPYYPEYVIRRKCGQTLGLGLGQIRYSSSIIISLQCERESTWLEVTWYDVIGLEESRESLGLRWCQRTWVPHSIHIVHAYMTEIKKYNIKAYGHDMVALR